MLNAFQRDHHLVSVLWYVVRRKKRPSVGWVMTEEDVFALCQWLDKSIEKIKGVTFSITTPGSSSDAATPVTAQGPVSLLLAC